MTSYFPRTTHDWHMHEPAAFRRLTLSLVESAIITGAILRLFRALVLTHGPSDSWLYLGGTLILAAVILFGMLSLHLANFTLRTWVWRVPLFALVASASEAAVSAGLIALDREPTGSARAVFADWPTLAADLTQRNLVAVCVFGVLLAGTVQLTRRMLESTEESRGHLV
jgi:hypothetical protein